MPMTQRGGIRIYRRTRSFSQKRELRRKVIAMERELVKNRGMLAEAHQKARHVAKLKEEVNTLRNSLATVITILPANSRKKIPRETKELLGIKES